MINKAKTTLDAEDAAARRLALEPGRSFIVQAPAGSGKTELLIQRYLVLLSLAREPEEIAAITFTRKAAAEMKLRVLQALDEARESVANKSTTNDSTADKSTTNDSAADETLAPHTRQTRVLARRVLAREAEGGWQLGANAQRLRIQTFDALCASLTRQMPVLSAFGAQPRSVENAGSLYREAARATLAQLDDEAEHANDIALLLVHLDNNLSAVENLLADMLARRDHWLPHLGSVNQREHLERGLARARRAARASVAALFPPEGLADLCELARYAAGNLAANGSDSPIVACAQLDALPGVGEEEHETWLGIASLLLTNEGEWRSGLNVKLGFPAGVSKAERELAKQWKLLHATLVGLLDFSPGLAEVLDALRALPAPRYSDEQWQVLESITRLLPLAVAQLKLVFAARGEADFVEVAQRANLALGDAEAPTDLMLALDYRIHHLLVDEFQDTSYTQFALLEKLTAGWNAGETSIDDRTEKTLFLVGDPMQSIYRFRQAEVGLFLHAKQQGLGGILLEPLTLSANFRSRQGIVDWVNSAFNRVMPARDAMATGAVSYSPSGAVHRDESPPEGRWGRGRVFVHAGQSGPVGEAERLVEIIRAAHSARPDGSVAVLVRNRGHLRAIVPVLRRAGLAFQAIDIEPLGHRQAVQDVYCLTRALAHAEDRIAWLAVLRAPWCGLTLADLHALVGVEVEGVAEKDEKQKDLFGEFESGRASPIVSNTKNGLDTVWELLHSSGSGLSADGLARLARLRLAMALIVDNPLRGSLRARVETAWLALGGPACVEDESDIEDIDIYFECLAEHEAAGEISDVVAFDEAVAGLYALPDARGDERLQIMTIHKAKGLEFDTVIVPGLHAGKRNDDKRLLAWMETPLGEDDEESDGNEESDSNQESGRRGTLLIAPINPAGSDDEPTYQYLRQLEKVKARHEETRLLYVAATRAREELHWLGEARLDKDNALALPSAESLLARLWPVVEGEYAMQLAHTVANAAIESAQGSEAVSAVSAQHGGVSQVLRRLRTDWRPPANDVLTWNAPPRDDAGRDAVEFSWAGETARHLGSVAHRWIQRIAEEGLAAWNDSRVENLRDAFHAQLAARGVAESECGAAAGRVAEALKRTLSDQRGQWLLGERREAKSEYRLSSMNATGR
ncbi:MAG: UvrD-helicase domain-containing protein, partial [Burkholderiales bacterium]